MKEAETGPTRVLRPFHNLIQTKDLKSTCKTSDFTSLTREYSKGGFTHIWVTIMGQSSSDSYFHSPRWKLYFLAELEKMVPKQAVIKNIGIEYFSNSKKESSIILCYFMGGAQTFEGESFRNFSRNIFFLGRLPVHPSSTIWDDDNYEFSFYTSHYSP